MTKLDDVLLVASGDSRQSANERCWPAQEDMERRLSAAVGRPLRRAHPYRSELRHGFIASQKEGMAVFAGLDADASLIVAEAVDQFDTLVRPACRLRAVADQRAYLLALRQQMPCRRAANFSRNSHH